jgi:hypothetical protein
MIVTIPDPILTPFCPTGFIPITLDPDSARALKKRRDAELKSE